MQKCINLTNETGIKVRENLRTELIEGSFWLA